MASPSQGNQAVGDNSQGSDNISTQPTAFDQDATNPNTGNRKRQQFLRQASVPLFLGVTEKPCLRHRWLHSNEASSGGGVAGSSSSSSKTSWNVFGPRDDWTLEKAWNEYQSCIGKRNQQGQDEKEKEEREGKERGKEKEKEKEEIMLDLPDPNISLPNWRVPVAEDRLFEVDLRTRMLWPVFWKGKGCQVLRGTWFFDSSKISPCRDDVAAELEGLYESIKPWLPSYADELRSSVALGSDAEDKLKSPLKSLKYSYVIFLGPHLARIYTDDVSTRITKTLFTAWSGSHGGGTLIARGYDNARRLLKTRSGDKGASAASKRISGGATKKGASAKVQDAVSASPKLAPKPVNAAPQRSGDESPIPSKGVSNSQDSSVHAPTEPLKKEEIKSEPSKPSATGEPPASGVEATPVGSSSSADLLRSIASKFPPWTTGSSATSSVTNEQQSDIKEAFAQAQADVQGMESVGLGDDTEEGGKEENEGKRKEAEDMTAEEEAKKEEEEFQREIERDEQPVDLVLVWHGIGQKMAEEWKSMDFTVAVSSLRTLVHKRASSPAPSDVGGGGFPSMIEGRRVQFLPVMWRATLEDFEPPELDSEHHPEEHLDNRFGLDDIFADSIPLIRQLISGILLDIPMYLSQHKDEILMRVIRETNHIWSLFAQRNPNFVSRGGRTSLIAHSLGAALATDVLSRQPTKAKSMDQLPSPGAELAFDVRNLYLVGSPVALFMWLNRSQLIARSGRENTMDALSDEALERSGRWGCLAVDRVFNVFSATDPIGTRLNSTVDAEYAKRVKSISLARAIKSILRTLPGALDAPLIVPGTGFFSGWTRGGASGAISRGGSTRNSEEQDRPDGAELDLLASSPQEGATKDAKWLKKLASRKFKFQEKRSSSRSRDGGREEEGEAKAKNPDNRSGEWEGVIGHDPETKEVEAETESVSEGEEQGKDQSRGKRRMIALCELGSIDYVMPLQTSLLTNQYMDFLWSHAGYWNDQSFADFLLATLFASSDQLKDAGKKLDKEP